MEDQAYQVDLVKRTQTGMITNPITIGPEASLEDLDALCGQYRVSGLPVVAEDLTLLGIITNRDLRFVPVAEWASTLVADVMTPMPLVTAPLGISREDATAILRQHKRERLPIVDDSGISIEPPHRSGRCLPCHRLLPLPPDRRKKDPEDSWNSCQGPATVVVRPVGTPDASDTAGSSRSRTSGTTAASSKTSSRMITRSVPAPRSRPARMACVPSSACLRSVRIRAHVSPPAVQVLSTP
ncbi:MAG: CBS domain-containing protein [Mycobacteriales bacterium]